MRPVEFGEALPPGTRLTLFADDKPDRFFTVIEFSIDQTLGQSLDFESGIPRYRVEDEEGRIHSLVYRRRKRTPTNGGFGDPIRQLWIPELFLMARWLRTRTTLEFGKAETNHS
jgi:hypothetical protein